MLLALCPLGEKIVRSLKLGASLLALFSPLIFACNAEANLKGRLIVQVNELKDQKGLLCIKVFNGSQGFPDSNEKALKRDCVKITADPMVFTYRDLPSSNYGVAVFHDSNGDRKLNRNSAGMPLEGYGFSKNPVIKAGPPKYGQTVFLVAGPATKVQINMRYSP